MSEVKITLKGSFSNRDASVDEKALALAGVGGSQSATTTFGGPGEHKLKWSVTGAPGARYTVSIAGDCEAWTEDFTMPSGRDAGFKRFHVR